MKKNNLLLLVCLACLPLSGLARKVQVMTTTADRAQSFNLEKIKSVATPENSLQIIIDPAVQYQKMDGFGAAVTGSSCYNLMQMSEEKRKDFLVKTFSDTKGLGYSYIRISIGCSDFSLSEYTCCDKPGIENFALQEEELKYVIPILKEILEINPEIKILGSPWTCPKWMKVDNLNDLKPFDSWTSGQLNPKYYQDYAGVAIECQGYSDAVHHPHFPSIELKAGELYCNKIVFRLGQY